MTGLASHGDPPAGLLHEPVDLAQAEAGAFGDRLGAEEGLEQMGQDLGAIPTPVSLTVSATQPPSVTGIGSVAAAVRGIRRGQREHAALGHGVARIDHEIDQRVLRLRRVQPRPAESRSASSSLIWCLDMPGRSSIDTWRTTALRSTSEGATAARARRRAIAGYGRWRCRGRPCRTSAAPRRRDPSPCARSG